MALAKRPDVTAVLTLVTSFSALILGVTLYSLTRDEDPDLALLALTLSHRRSDSRPRGRDLLRRRQHDLLLAPSPRPNDPCRAGLARRRCLSAARRHPSASARRTFWRSRELVVVGDVDDVAAGVSVRDRVRGVVAHRRRPSARNSPRCCIDGGVCEWQIIAQRFRRRYCRRKNRRPPRSRGRNADR